MRHREKEELMMTPGVMADANERTAGEDWRWNPGGLQCGTR